MKLSRRQFLAITAVAGLGAIGGYLYIFGKRRAPIIPSGDNGTVNEASKVYVVKTTDRSEGTRMLLGKFDDIDFRDKTVALKANFNSADPPPASTHLDTLEELVGYLRDAGAGDVTLAERSGMGNTGAVLDSMGVNELGERLGFDVISLEDIGADRVIQTCCLKTHRYGGHFTMSLKNSVGLVAKKVPGDSHDYMQELHTSPLQRVMIGEINAFYGVDIAVIDAIEAFVIGGPAKGELVNPGLMLASCDRVALDAVGVAILRSHGSTQNVMKGKVFELDQILRAAEIGVGVSSAEDIELVPLNDGAIGKVEEIQGYLSS
jgi:uncharacterized protein (DUF362 family)